jgi:hypothetical protein
MDMADDIGLATLHPHLDASSMAAAFPKPKGGAASCLGHAPRGSLPGQIFLRHC